MVSTVRQGLRRSPQPRVMCERLKQHPGRGSAKKLQYCPTAYETGYVFPPEMVRSRQLGP